MKKKIYIFQRAKIKSLRRHQIDNYVPLFDLTKYPAFQLLLRSSLQCSYGHDISDLYEKKELKDKNHRQAEMVSKLRHIKNIYHFSDDENKRVYVITKHIHVHYAHTHTHTQPQNIYIYIYIYNVLSVTVSSMVPIDLLKSYKY